MSEEWRAIPGYAAYEVSDQGRVRSCKRYRDPHILRPGNSGGRKLVALMSTNPDGTVRQNSALIHSLLLLAFVGPRPADKPVIRHLDGNPSNNTLGNLIYGTHSENQADCIRHGRHYNASKTHCPSGHPYDDANTYFVPSRPGGRYCLACRRIREATKNPEAQREYNRRHYEANKDAINARKRQDRAASTDSGRSAKRGRAA